MAGVLLPRDAKRQLVARPGDVAVVPPRTPHRFWNAGEGVVRFRCEVRPALQFESLIETMFTLAVEGKTNRRGLPNPFRLAVIAQAHCRPFRRGETSMGSKLDAGLAETN